MRPMLVSLVSNQSHVVPGRPSMMSRASSRTRWRMCVTLLSALKTFRAEVLDPDGVEVAFGVKFNAEAGAVIANTSAGGHLAVKLTWSRSESG